MTTAQAEKVPVGQVKISSMNPVVMLVALKRLGIKKKLSTTSQMFQALKKHFEQKAIDSIEPGEGETKEQAAERAKKTLMHCESCGGLSTVDEAACPYCGDGEVEAPKQEVETTGETVAEASAPMPPEAKSGTRRLKSLPGGKADKAKAEAAPAPKAKKSTAVKNAEPAPPAVLSVADLDQAVAKVLECRGRTAESLWQLGTMIKDIYDRELWALREGEDGKPKYTRFNTFCEVELGISKTTAYGLMDIVKLYTPEQLEKHGTEKLKLLVGVPESERQRLLGEMDGGKGPSVREIRGSKTKPAPEVTAGDVQGAVTVVIRVSEEPVRIAMVKANGGKKKKPATSLEDLPTCVEEHENGVVSTYTLVTDADTGQIFLQRLTTRS